MDLLGRMWHLWISYLIPVSHKVVYYELFSRLAFLSINKLSPIFWEKDFISRMCAKKFTF